VQDTLLRAWDNFDRFEPGTSLHAWLFTILRNLFLTEYRKRKREVEDPDGIFAAHLAVEPEQYGKAIFADFRGALARLPVEQREALLLVGAEGLTYEEAARVCGIPSGTMKSRASRARKQLSRLLGQSS
jgi:RNA polymerase sigma-70 factor (ECF subfamily)